MTELFAVAGKPVLHSMSPQMHNAAFAAVGIDAVYVRLAAESAEDALESAGAAGMSGMNVTSPFKEDMAALVQAGDESVRRLGAVNTVLLHDGQTVGYDTDADGVAGALRENGVAVKGRKAVVLGAGGAAKAATLALVEGGADVMVMNRTAGKAEAIAGMLGCGHCALDEGRDALRDADVLVSALSTGERVIEPGLLKRDIAVLDANYSTETALARDAKKNGCKTIDGREWLLYQGARAFELFSKREAPVAVMRKALYSRHGTRNRKLETGNLALIGMMGSGKDTVAKALERRSGMGIIDTDAEIEKKAGKRIKDIFADDGEDGFRRMECAEIRAAAKARGKIMNCGGGAVLKAQNRKSLGRNAIVAWLWANPKTMVARVAGDDSRPLLHVPDHEKESVLKKLLDGRRRFYAEAADLMIDTSDRTPDEVAGRILHEADKARSG
jgi:shikimate dehydrogenase